MGGSEGVMQVADYGEIQFETWLNSSYGTISPNRNHTNETINAFRISSSGDIDGIIRMKRSMHLEFLLLEISMVEIGYSPLVPTAFGRNILPNSFKNGG